MKKKIGKLRKHANQIGAQVREKILNFVLVGFSMVAALAWNEAVKDMLGYVFPLEKDSVWAKFIYAVIVTLVFVFVSIFLVWLLKGKKTK